MRGSSQVVSGMVDGGRVSRECGGKDGEHEVGRSSERLRCE